MNKASFLKTLFLACILLMPVSSFSSATEGHDTESAHSEEFSSNDYISHHLVFNSETIFSGEENGFWTLHLDSLFYSVFMALLFCATFYFAARKATINPPSGWLGFVEMVVVLVDEPNGPLRI